MGAHSVRPGMVYLYNWFTVNFLSIDKNMPDFVNICNNA